MNSITTIILVNISVFLVIFVIWVIHNRKEILSFIDPGNWTEITMLESDNNVSTWLQKKNPDLRFKFNDGMYNMFEQKIPTPTGKFNYKYSSVYRSGRLAKFFYIEGNENPIDLRHLSITGNPQLDNELQKIDISRLFSSDSGTFGNLWKDYGGIITTAGIVTIIIIIVLRTGSS